MNRSDILFKNKFLFMLLSFLFLISLSFWSVDTVFADEIEEGLVVSGDEINVDLSGSGGSGSSNTGIQAKVSSPNAVTINVTPSVTGVTLRVRNYGVDTVDSISVEMVTPNYYNATPATLTKRVTFYNVKPVVAYEKTLSIPMIRSEMYYKGSITIRDGKKIVYKTSNSSLKFSEEVLGKEWLKGRFKNVRQSIDYHFGKHYNDKYVNVRNLKQYLDKASLAKKQMQNVTKTSSLYTFKLEGNSIKVTQKGSVRQYILINKDSKKLYSYGGN